MRCPVPMMPWRGVAALHLAPQVRVLLRQLVLIAAQFADQLRGLDGDGGVRGQRRQRFLVARGEDAAALVERLECADDLAVLIAHGHGQQVARAVAGLVVDAVVEARVAVGVADVDGVRR